MYALRRAVAGDAYANEVAATIERGDRKRVLWRAIRRIEHDPEKAFLLAKESIHSDEADTRRMAIYGLRRLRDPRATGMLCEALGDPDAAVAGNAARALGELGDRSAVDDLLAVLGRQGLPRSLQTVAVTALGLLPDRRSIWTLAGALASSNPRVQRRAAWSLGQIADPESLAALRGSRPRSWWTRIHVGCAITALQERAPELGASD